MEGQPEATDCRYCVWDRIAKRHLLGADQALKFDFDWVFSLGAIPTFPWLKLQVRQLPGMAANGQRDDVIKFVFGHMGVVDSRFAQELALDPVRLRRTGRTVFV